MLNYRVFGCFRAPFGGPWLVLGVLGPVRASFRPVLKGSKKRRKEAQKGPFSALFGAPGRGHWPHYGFGAGPARAPGRKTPKIGSFWGPRGGRVRAGLGPFARFGPPDPKTMSIATSFGGLFSLSPRPPAGEKRRKTGEKQAQKEPKNRPKTRFLGPRKPQGAAVRVLAAERPGGGPGDPENSPKRARKPPKIGPFRARGPQRPGTQAGETPRNQPRPDPPKGGPKGPQIGPFWAPLGPFGPGGPRAQAEETPREPSLGGGLWGPLGPQRPAPRAGGGKPGFGPRGPGLAPCGGQRVRGLCPPTPPGTAG